MEKKTNSFDFLKFYNGTYASLEKLLPLEITLEFMNDFFKNIRKVETDKDMYNDLKTFELEKERYSNISLKVKLVYFSVHLCHCFYAKDGKSIKDFVAREKSPYIWLNFDANENVKLINGTFKSLNVILHTVRSVRDMKTSEFQFGKEGSDQNVQFALRKDQNNQINFIRGSLKNCIFLLTFEMKFVGCYNLNSTFEELSCNFFHNA
jgi:hypothetical protein